MAKLFDLDDTRNKGEQECKDFLKKARVDAKTSEEHIVAERDGAFSSSHSVLRSIRRHVEREDECDAGYTDTLTQLQLLFDEERKVTVVSSPAGPSWEELQGHEV